MKEDVPQQEPRQYCEPWETWADSQLQDENGEWRAGWSEEDFEPLNSQRTLYYEKDEGEEKVEETTEGQEAKGKVEDTTAKTPEAGKVEETTAVTAGKVEDTTAKTPEAGKVEETTAVTAGQVQDTTAETPEACRVEETTGGTPEASKVEETTAGTQQDAEEDVEKDNVVEDPEKENNKCPSDDSKEEQPDDYMDPHADFGARSWPGRCTIHDPRGLRWKFWDKKWWLGFPPLPDDDMDDDLWTDPAGWSVHSEMASTVVPSWAGSDGEIAAIEAERRDPNQGKHPYIRDQILQKKEEHKQARQKRKARQEQEERDEAGEVLWTPLTKQGFNDFILACSGGCPQVEHPSSTLSIHATSTVPKKTEPKVRWRPCTSQGVVAFRNMFAQASMDPLNMNLEELIKYSHDLKDYAQVPKQTPDFVLATIKYIVYLYDEWGVAHPDKVNEWLQLRLGYFSAGEV